MGCKCGRNFAYGENEIIKSEFIKNAHNNRNNNLLNNRNNFNTLNNNQIKETTLTNNTINNETLTQKNSNNKKPEINITYKKENETLLTNNKITESLNPSINTQVYNTEITYKNEYPQKAISLINKIRSDPLSYSNIVEESIKNIKTNKNNRIIYYDVVKVALHRGKDAFKEAIDKLKSTGPMPPLRYNPKLCIPLPKNEEELEDQNYLKEQVDKIKARNTNIEIYFKDLIRIPEVAILLMIVDDNSKNSSKKRDTLLNKDFKYIGVNSVFIGKKFVAHFSFSR